MFQVSRYASSLLFTLTLLISFAVVSALTPAPANASGAVAPQKKDKESKKESKKEKKSKTESDAPAISQSPTNASSFSKEKNSKKVSASPTRPGAPSLWEDRGDISKLNLIMGIGSEAGMPKAPFQFDKEDITGTNPKIKVIDANGVKWNIRFDEEVYSEV